MQGPSFLLGWQESLESPLACFCSPPLPASRRKGSCWEAGGEENDGAGSWDGRSMDSPFGAFSLLRLFLAHLIHTTGSYTHNHPNFASGETEAYADVRRASLRSVVERGAHKGLW